jgi:hypothetical protein
MVRMRMQWYRENKKPHAMVRIRGRGFSLWLCSHRFDWLPVAMHGCTLGCSRLQCVLRPSKVCIWDVSAVQGNFGQPVFGTCLLSRRHFGQPLDCAIETHLTSLVRDGNNEHLHQANCARHL